ncbi:hypothetical protein Pan216_32860 [Planctomycetes bacterium Pan216]|uniref:Translational regulator CsrA n=1 Tax=Kolteria novifilia TaxID=2527975 RepID=A0A518B613_9BACT|nr:hypothetical protein Pan216_32860 [Planctomycetes bacterium Pan216]
MLVLRRKEGQWIRVGDSIDVRVLGLQGGRVRIGISAPDDVLILRGEAIEKSDAIAELELDLKTP